MAVNPDQLWSTLDKIEQKLLSIVDDFDAVSQAAVALGGNVAKVLPIQLNSSADAVLELVNGNGQNSIKNLKDYVDNIPLGDLRTKSAGEAIRTGQREAPTPGNAPTAPAIDTTPHIGEAPKSAIVNESQEINLDDYKKKPMKEVKKMDESGSFSFDAIMDETGIDDEGYDSDIPEADTDYLESDLTDGFSDEFEPEDDSFNFDEFEADRLASQEGDDIAPSYQDAFDYGEEFSENY